MRYLNPYAALFLALGLIFMITSLRAQGCYELVWSDEFNYTGLPDPAKWTHEVGGGGYGNNELQYYTENRLENSRVEDGNLIIEARKEMHEANNYTSARLITYKNGHSFRYGRIEARMKLPHGQGIWPAFWMLGDGIFEGTPWPACGELDITEMVGGGSGKDDVVHGTIHWSDANGNNASYGGKKQLSEGIFADEFHLFSIEWDATSIRWYLDGAQYHVVDITPVHLSEFHKDFFIILNLAIGGNWPGNPDASTVFPQKMYVDYVRVYQLNTIPEIVGDTSVIAGEKGVRYSTVESEDFAYSWTLPSDASIIEGQGTNTIVVDWGCDTGTIFCNLTTLCETYSLQHNVSLKELEISGKDFVEAFEPGLSYFVPPSRDASQNWLLPEGVLVNSGIDSNYINLDWNDSDGVIQLTLSNYCGSDTASKLVKSVKQMPYPNPDQPHILPGTLSSVHFDTGGEGFAYHDTEPENLGSGSRQDEGVDTEPNDSDENIGWLENGEWLEYTIHVESPGTYDADIRIASPNPWGRFKLFFGGEERTDVVAVPQTGSWSSFTTIAIKDIQLYETDQIMRIHIVNGQFNMGRLFFRESGPTRIQNDNGSEGIYLYPTIANQHIFVKNISSAHRYTLTGMAGQVVESGIIKPDGMISVQELSPGVYLLNLNMDEKTVFAGRFYKIN